MEKEEVTQGDIELCYRLGQISTICRNGMELNFAKKTADGVSIVEDKSNVESLFREFIQIAQKFNIVLPEQLPQEYIEQDKTFCEQLSKVSMCLQNKNEHLRIAFHAGMHLEHLQFVLRIILYALKTSGPNEKVMRERIDNIGDDVQLLADEKGVDISEELGTLANYETELSKNIDIYRLILKLKKKFCSLATNENSTNRSAIDDTRMISNEYWVISLVRLPDRGSYEHAFLVLEAKTGIISKIWFIDFVAAQEADLFLPGIRDGKVRIKMFQSEATVGSSSELLFHCRKSLMDVRRNERLLFSSWPICRLNAEIFLQNVEAQQGSPPKYNILGDSMLAGSSAKSSSEDIGHNCYTFARKMLLDLNDQHIQLPADKLGEWVYSASSRFLRDPQLERHKWQMIRFPMLLAFLVGVAVSYIIFKLLT